MRKILWIVILAAIVIVGWRVIRARQAGQEHGGATMQEHGGTATP